MKYFTTGLLLLTFVFACSPTETVTEPEEDRADLYAAPGWYNDLELSKADSVSIYGMAFAASSDSSDAADQSKKLAEQNLLLAIDQLTENVRTELSEETGNFDSPDFIITLRNTIADLNITGVDFETEHVHYQESIHHIYTRGTIPIGTVKQLLSQSSLDQRFVNAID